jgi:quinoprotein glucose dehydrogenase
MRASLLFLLAWTAQYATAADARWPAYLGGPGSEQYSSLAQINKSNVKQLQVVWTYPTGEKGNYLF